MMDEKKAEEAKPTASELSQKAFHLSQRLSTQLHQVMQMDTAGEECSQEKNLATKTLATLTAACKAAGI